MSQIKQAPPAPAQNRSLKTEVIFCVRGASSLVIGDNAEPVQTLLTTITVHDAVGTGYNGVDVDISALAFSPDGTDAINVVGDVIGGFPLDSGGSLIVPDPIVPAPTQPGWDDGDGCCVNWEGSQEDAYAIATGASSGPVPPGLPGTGAIGYGIWNVYSIDAWKVEPPIDFGNWVLRDATGTKGGVNIFALGGEGSPERSAADDRAVSQTRNLQDEPAVGILQRERIDQPDWARHP